MRPLYLSVFTLTLMASVLLSDPTEDVPLPPTIVAHEEEVLGETSLLSLFNAALMAAELF